MDGKLWYLKQCDLFEQLAPQQAERLERHALKRMFHRHDIIYFPADPGQSVLVLVSGRVKIKDITPDGKETILTFIEEGELFGELALVSDGERGEYAEAMVDSEVVAIPRTDLLWLMETRADVALSITKLVGLRRRRIENRLRNLLFFSSRDRMLRLLLELAENYGEKQGERCTIRLPLSHQELANLIGVTRETTTVLMGQFQKEGLIAVQRRRITVVSLRRLAENTRGSSPAGDIGGQISRVKK